MFFHPISSQITVHYSQNKVIAVFTHSRCMLQSGNDCIHVCCQISKSFHLSNLSSAGTMQSSPLCLTSLWISMFWIFKRNRLVGSTIFMSDFCHLVDIFKVQPHCSACQNLITFRLNNTPFRGHDTFFLHLSAHGLLICLSGLAIVNTMPIGL